MGLMILAAALACTPLPSSAAELEAVALERVRSAAAVVEATVLLVPPGGLLRVDRVLSGQAPITIVVPHPSPCTPTFTRIGQRGLVIVEQSRPPSGFVDGALEAIVRRILQEPR